MFNGCYVTINQMSLYVSDKVVSLLLEYWLNKRYNKNIETHKQLIDILRLGGKSMFFKKRNQEEKKDLLYKQNICINCTETEKKDVIKKLGQMLVGSGYVNAQYIDGMFEREETFSTFMGNGLVIPHGVESAKKEVMHSGIAVMTFPEGIKWGEETARIAVGIASVGEDHLNILSAISEQIMDTESAEKLITGDVDTIYNMLTGKG